MPKSKRSSSSSKPAAKSRDAVALLKEDHRQVEKLFSEFDKAQAAATKDKLASQICSALTIHAVIEEEIFYPAFLAATKDKELHHEAAIEHDGAKKLISEIESSSSKDEFFDARVTVLSEMIKHHVKEEEQPGGMFAEARESEMNLDALGQQLKDRKVELEKNGGSFGLLGLAAGLLNR